MIFYYTIDILIIYTFTVSLFSVTGYTYDAYQDRVTSLPLSSPKDFRSAQFSGYLQISPIKEIHYIYYESESSPSTDPLVLSLLISFKINLLPLLNYFIF